MSSSNSEIPLMGYIGIGISGVIALSALCFCIFYLAKPKRRKPLVPAGQLVPPRPLIPSFKVPSFGSGRRQQRGDTPSILPDSTVQALPSLSSPPHSALSLSNTSSSMHSARPDSSSEASQLGSSRSWFTFEELQAATDNFPMVNLLGEGGFGCVYKGTLLGGQVVAVKQLKVGGGQGEREFRAEVEIISRVHHRHLVSLVGYCVAESQRLLVYEYVPNGTLEYHLHGKGRPVMDWQTRQKIAVGTSRGIAYLHEDCHPRIIHRDIKSSNILLDSNFEALVSDFGLAKLTSDTNTHVSTRVVGTFGYLAPEYASTGKLTEKSDVFSFGVVLLELITGQKPVDSALLIEEGLVEWSRPLLIQAQEENNLKVIADPKLNGNYNEKEMMRMIEVAAACVRHSTRKRPRMSLVVRALEEEVTISGLNKGVKPGHSSLHGQSYGESMDYDSAQYRVDMGKMRQLALGTSQEYGSEYSRSTSEYGAKSSSYSSDQSSMEVAPKPTSPPAKSARNSSSSNEMNA